MGTNGDHWGSLGTTGDGRGRYEVVPDAADAGGRWGALGGAGGRQADLRSADLRGSGKANGRMERSGESWDPRATERGWRSDEG